MSHHIDSSNIYPNMVGGLQASGIMKGHAKECFVRSHTRESKPDHLKCWKFVLPHSFARSRLPKRILRKKTSHN